MGVRGLAGWCGVQKHGESEVEAGLVDETRDDGVTS